MICGNTNAIIQVKTSTGKNVIGENVESFVDIGTVLGFLDYSSGQNDVIQYNAKVQDSTHIFICDYFRFTDATQDADVNSENIRMIVNNNKYDVLLIDDPMGLHQHLEIYLKYVGGGLGVK